MLAIIKIPRIIQSELYACGYKNEQTLNRKTRNDTNDASGR